MRGRYKEGLEVVGGMSSHSYSGCVLKEAMGTSPKTMNTKHRVERSENMVVLQPEVKRVLCFRLLAGN